jgi:autotransporter-associated beta strand protein
MSPVSLCSVGSQEIKMQFQYQRKLIIGGLILSCFSGNLSAATVTWDGGGGDDFWNYAPVGNGTTKYTNWGPNGKLPANGDDLEFSGTTRLANTNIVGVLEIANLTFMDGAGEFILSGSQLDLTGSVTNNSTSLQTINMDLGLNATATLAATVGDIVIGGATYGVISGSNGINVTGPNHVILTRANTYTGTTTVTTGTLLANNASGSATGTGAVDVSGTLGGIGTIAPTDSNSISVSGMIAPGSGTIPGTLTINLTSTLGGLNMSTDSSFQFHLGAAGIGDMLAIVGAFSGDVAFDQNNINFMGTGALGSYKIFDTDSNNANTWTGLTINGSGQITVGLTGSNLANGYTANFYMGGYSYGGDSGDIYVQVIPEPRTALLGSLGTAVLLLLRRRRLVRSLNEEG